MKQEPESKQELDRFAKSIAWRLTGDCEELATNSDLRATWEQSTSNRLRENENLLTELVKTILKPSLSHEVAAESREAVKEVLLSKDLGKKLQECNKARLHSANMAVLSSKVTQILKGIACVSTILRSTTTSTVELRCPDRHEADCEVNTAFKTTSGRSLEANVLPSVDSLFPRQDSTFMPVHKSARHQPTTALPDPTSHLRPPSSGPDEIYLSPQVSAASSEIGEQGDRNICLSTSSIDSSSLELLAPLSGSVEPTVARWNYILPPCDEPDPHELKSCSSRKFEGGVSVVGARVRGKKHKHDGTHCDDWYEFAQSGVWTIIAVSDGAGSARISRVGAKTACQAAVASLKVRLETHSLEIRDNWDNDTFARAGDWTYEQSDIDAVQSAIHEAFRVAHNAIADAQLTRVNSVWPSILGRPPELKDFSCTLLLAVHCRVPTSSGEKDFVMACHVGDGYVAALDSEGRLVNLCTPDTGAFSGETEFITGKKNIELLNMRQHTYPLFRNLKTLMVMSDGVSDDYFPPDPHMRRLYADLSLNGILRTPEVESLDGSTLRLTSLYQKTDWQQILKGWAYHDIYERHTGVAEAEHIKVRSATTFAERLGLRAENLDFQLLALAKRGDWDWNDNNPLAAAKTSEERLLIWLDSYHRRGSFDDRTLVLLNWEPVT